jgi:hypothetical protein
VTGSSPCRSPHVFHVHAAAFNIGDQFKMESTEVLQAPVVGKLQVVDRVPKVIEKLEFGILSVFLAPRCCGPSDQDAGRVKTLSINPRSKYLIDASSTLTKVVPSILMGRLTLVWAFQESETSVKHVIKASQHAMVTLATSNWYFLSFTSGTSKRPSQYYNASARYKNRRRQ